MSAVRRLYRSGDDRKIGGVASGLAEHLNIDPLIVRILFVVGLCFGGASMFIYMLMWLIVPRDPDTSATGASSSILSTIFKALMILVGIAIISESFGSEIGLVSFAIGLMVGLYFYWRSRQPERDEAETSSDSDLSSRMHRSSSDKKILGVFGGLAETFGFDPTLLRIVGVVLLFVAFPVTLVAYFGAAMLMPKSQMVIRIE